MPLSPGVRFGAYEIGSLIGAGGMGKVYRARDTKLQRDVAIKIVHEGLAATPKAVRRFETEAKAVAALSHPNVLSIFDFGVQGGTPYAAMELLDGRTLQAVLADGPLSSRKTAEYGMQIGAGLAEAHAHGIVHRDLKPANVFITRDGHVKVLDFGLAKTQPAADAATADTTTISAISAEWVLGTVGYMAPEQVRGDTIDHRCDIFAMGAVLYEMVAGRRAFAGDSAVATMNAVLKDEPPPIELRGTPRALDRIIRRCLEKNPDERFQSARDVSFAIDAIEWW